MFGSSSMFGANKSFSSNTSTGFGFGATSAFGTNNEGPDGSTIPFEPVRGNDTMIRNGDTKEIQTKNMCMSAMEQYKNKSLEEIRVSDYAANRKGSANKSSNMFGSFNSTPAAASSTGSTLFGSAPKPATGSLFGTTTSFGQTQQQPQQQSTGGLFGSFGSAQQPAQQSTTGTSLFGSTPKPTFGSGSTTSGLFGGNQQTSQPAASGSLFGNNASNQGGSLFGNSAKPATGSLFSNTSSTFGTPQNQQQQPSAGGSLFGSFGNNQQQTNQPAASGSLFGNNASNQSGSLFGNTAKPAFGSGTTTGGLFGGNQQSSQPAAGGSLFGNNSTQNTGGLFGNTAKPASGSFFGTNTFGASNQQQPQQSMMNAPAQSQVQPIYLGGRADETAVQRLIIESQLSSLPYGDNTIFKQKNGLPISSSSTLSKGEDSNVQSQLRKLANQALSPSGTNSSVNASGTNLNISAMASPNTSFSYKPLVALPSLGFAPMEGGRSSLNLSLRSSPQRLSTSRNNSILNDSKKSNGFTPKSFDASILKSKSSPRNHVHQQPSQSNVIPTSAPFDDASPQEARRRSVCFADLPNLMENQSPNADHISNGTSVNGAATQLSSLKSILITPETRRTKESLAQQPFITPLSSQTSSSAPVVIETTSVETTVITAANLDTSQNLNNSSILELEGYYVEPSIDGLEKTLKNGKYFVHGGLSVGRTGYGSVFWPGDFELSSLDFENFVSFRLKEVVVYPDDATKPPLGVDLNRPAEVSLECVWLFDIETKEYIKDPTQLGKLQFRARLERSCQRMDARFIDYQVSTGTWTFGVGHFSKYGLADEEDEPMISPQEMELLKKQEERRLKVQRLAVEKKKVPFREIYDDKMNYSFPASGLGGVIHDTFINYDGKNVKIPMDDDMDFHHDLKRYKLDHDITKELLDSTDLIPPVDEAMMEIPAFTRQELVSRERDDKLVIVPKEGLLRLPFQHVRGRAETLMLKVPRAQWHPSEDFVILKQVEPNCFQTKRIIAIPSLNNYFERYLEADGRLDELPKLLESDLLRCNPPSFFIELLDSYILSVKRDTNAKDNEADEEIISLCRAILISPSTPNYEMEQRKRLGSWIQQKLEPYLSNILKNVSDDDANLASRIIFECLVHGNVKEAIQQAVRFKHLNLSLFLSLYETQNSPECKEAFASQHSAAERFFHSSHRDKYMMSIYQLLAGPKTKNGEIRGSKFISCLNGLSWLQIIGIFIWYGSSPADSLNDCVRIYKSLVTKEHIPAKPRNLAWCSQH